VRIGDCADDVRQSIATKIINLAAAGERNPDVLCERALKDIRGDAEAASVGGLALLSPDQPLRLTCCGALRLA
jgi:hypothetical protein